MKGMVLRPDAQTPPAQALGMAGNVLANLHTLIIPVNSQPVEATVTASTMENKSRDFKGTRTTWKCPQSCMDQFPWR